MEEPIFKRIAYLQKRREAALHRADQAAPGAMKTIAKETLAKMDTEMEQLKSLAATIIKSEPDPLMRRILSLRYLDGKSAAEISRTINYAESYVFKLLRNWGNPGNGGNV